MSDSNQVVEPQPPAAQPAPKPDTKPKAGELPPYHVVLLDDNEHTYEYVIDMLQSLFGHSEEQSFLLAEQVDRTGRAVVCTTHKERAELKREKYRPHRAALPLARLGRQGRTASAATPSRTSSTTTTRFTPMAPGGRACSPAC